ncbi:unnamed protein product [Linum tenue]|uniref:Methyltransferase n=1 Tax=Linum tenue TaxID=586396 RepID=A0AAV0HBH7_9ROSI|nr:unnamed protein product [Linum tenue]
MDSPLAVFSSAGAGALLVAGTLYCLFAFLLGPVEKNSNPAVNLSGGSIAAGNVRDKYEFRRPKETVRVTDKVPDFVDTFYNLVTDIYEWGWGQSFHFSPPVPGKSDGEASKLHELMIVDLIGARPGDRILDVGCGIGGPMRTIAAHSGANVVGITINDYQVNRARTHNKKAGLDKQCDVVQGNFLAMPFPSNSFDGAYSIEATCHAPKLEEVYAEIFRVLKPGALYTSYDWITTEKYRPEEDAEIIQGIERGNALPGLRSYSDITAAAREVGFEVVRVRDLAREPTTARWLEVGRMTYWRNHVPWWSRLKFGRIAYWRNHIVVSVLAAVGVAPKGTVDVHEMLCKTAEYLTKGGEKGIFSPMHMILCRKPAEK